MLNRILKDWFKLWNEFSMKAENYECQNCQEPSYFRDLELFKLLETNSELYKTEWNLQEVIVY